MAPLATRTLKWTCVPKPSHCPPTQQVDFHLHRWDPGPSRDLNPFRSPQEIRGLLSPCILSPNPTEQTCQPSLEPPVFFVFNHKERAHSGTNHLLMPGIRADHPQPDSGSHTPPPLRLFISPFALASSSSVSAQLLFPPLRGPPTPVTFLLA